MNEQSEHLSNAQIENYGDRTSGARPDADREAEQIEVHLQGCSSCRSHLLDFQRTHFALLANPKQPTDHTVNPASTSDCPSEDDLRQLAAGLLPEAVGDKLTRHAATCDHCGPLLRTYTEDFSDDFSQEEQAVLSSLQSSSARWQEKTAQQMIGAARATATGIRTGSNAAETNAGAPMAVSSAGSPKEPSMPSSTIVLDPKTQWFLKFLESMGRPQIFEVPVAEAREMYVRGNALVPVVKQPAQIEDRTIFVDLGHVGSAPVNPSSAGTSSAGPNTIDKGNVKLRIFRPEGNTSRLPVVMYFHGGGWVLGDADTYDYFMRELTNGSDAAVVFVEYSRSPEAKYPVALEECYAATRWIAEHGAKLNLNGAQIAVAGDSAGGNLATAVCLLAAKRKGPAIAAQVLIYPVTGHDFNSSSFEQFAKGYFLTREASQWFWKQYAPDESQSTACPMIATDDELKGMPPALIITGECDILRDEGEAYARKLMTAGIPVTCTRYLGAIHGFMGINALADTPIVRTATAQVNQALRDALAMSKSTMAAN